MMRFAIVSNGPSDGLYRPTVGAYDVTIGVNKAAVDFPFHWWCLCDWQTYFDWHAKVKGRPRLFTKSEMPESGARRTRDMTEPSDQAVYQKLLDEHKAGRVLLTKEIGRPELADQTPAWDSYSGVMAFILAWHLADACDAAHIDCYDFDMTTDIDRKGHRNHTRTPSRWQNEREIFDSIMAFFEQQRIVVERITPDGRIRCN